MSQSESSSFWMALADSYKVWRIFRTASLGLSQAWFFARLMYKAHVWAWHGCSETPLAQAQKDALVRALRLLQEISQEGRKEPAAGKGLTLP